MVQSMVMQDVILQALEIHRGAKIHLHPMEDPTMDQERSVKSPDLEEPAAETTFDKLMSAFIPHPPALLREKVEKTGNEVDPAKKREVGGRCFSFIFIIISHCPALIVLVNKLK